MASPRPSCRTTRTYDVIVVGARVAGSPTAMLLARKGYEVLLVTLEPPPPELLAVLAAMPCNQDAMDAFARVSAGVTSPAEFFSHENVESIMSRSNAARAVH